MIKKPAIVFTILAMLAFGACTCWGYTVSKWPVPGIPNEVFTAGPAGLGNAGDTAHTADMAAMAHTADMAGMAHTATRGIPAVMAQATLDGAGAGSLLSNGGGGSLGSLEL